MSQETETEKRSRANWSTVPASLPSSLLQPSERRMVAVVSLKFGSRGGGEGGTSDGGQGGSRSPRKFAVKRESVSSVGTPLKGCRLVVFAFTELPLSFTCLAVAGASSGS